MVGHWGAVTHLACSNVYCGELVLECLRMTNDVKFDWVLCKVSACVQKEWWGEPFSVWVSVWWAALSSQLARERRIVSVQILWWIHLTILMLVLKICHYILDISNQIITPFANLITLTISTQRISLILLLCCDVHEVRSLLSGVTCSLETFVVFLGGESWGCPRHWRVPLWPITLVPVDSEEVLFKIGYVSE